MTNEEERIESGEKPEEAPELNDIPSLRKALEEEKVRTGQYLYNWQRAQADFLNYKKSSEREKQEAVKYGNSLLLLNLLSALDDLQRAVDSLPSSAGAGWIEGIKLIQRKLLATLESQGLIPINAVGEPFDPFVHEAVSYQEGEENKVLAEVEKGYKFNDKVIRPARVIVGKGKAESQQAK